MIKSYLGKGVDVIIDRPLGSKHPKWDIYYTLNYGYIFERTDNSTGRISRKIL